eukprot:836257_1
MYRFQVVPLNLSGSGDPLHIYMNTKLSGDVSNLAKVKIMCIESPKTGPESTVLIFMNVSSNHDRVAKTISTIQVMRSKYGCCGQTAYKVHGVCKYSADFCMKQRNIITVFFAPLFGAKNFPRLLNIIIFR